MISLSVATMISTHWLEKRKRHWTRLEQLLEQRKNHGLNSLTRSELQELGLLYRQAAADLSALREDPSGKSYARFLNLLLARAHNTIYAGQKSRGSGIIHFYLYEYPRVFRRNLGLISIAFLLFVLGALTGLLLTRTDSIVGLEPTASSAIMTNNIGVCFFAFAGGITAGLFTIYLQVFNGVMIGVIGTACWLHGMSIPLWSFVAPHGVLELPAIFISGGAGLRIAQGMLFPGLLTRRDSIAKSGREAVRLVLGIIPMLIVAGIIEGFISPSGLNWKFKFALAAAISVIFWAYLLISFRRTADEQPVKNSRWCVL